MTTSTATDAVDVVERVLAVRGWPDRVAELAVAARVPRSEPTGLARALEQGELIRTYAFRGGAYLLRPDDAAALHAVRTCTRVWETDRYQRQAGFSMQDWAPFRELVREALAPGPLTRSEIAARLRGDPRLRHLADAALGGGADTLYKPLHWWGEICFGPARDREATFQLVPAAARRPVPDLDDAGREAVRRYLRGYGPASTENVEYWLAKGLSAPRRRVAGWLADLESVAVEVDGVRRHLLEADLEAVRATEPTDTVRLLPGYDPWVLGAGTADGLVVPTARRAPVTRGSDVVVRGGLVSGTWRARDEVVAVTWFSEAGAPPTAALEEEARRLGRARVTIESD